jgi:hypothetical protein
MICFRSTPLSIDLTSLLVSVVNHPKVLNFAVFCAQLTLVIIHVNSHISAALDKQQRKHPHYYD